MADGIHAGGHSPELVGLIQSLTITDLNGRRYYRRNVYEGFRRLRTVDDYRALNAAIDRGRDKHNAETIS